ncbi:ABC transporter ATP-binding protein [Burkholderia multivorans]|uniref:ABC transporter ATP-binding protein n=1 Tax=Burkholderia multivorans TaxID=87883 RepID=UPI00158CD4E2|nr:ABC transporter ATP-binding protein [Burkholderia multivorans]MCA8480460.1 ABC transporter ATP-binding protein [Burkholderia multivorans]MDR9054474.1 Teichoic acids export ATP-binding protein TagH [Burkholderia multivorans]MDR9060541.1 Teichoic acids export ATP-binding protein TagH [Burkholderia multivorans]MDR9064194.1 Teichoic acids export ATP-binding protein TagH [Burkholderia multivorans]MDR9078131.1 Teichoic acids export ATP-binding protein TagH [Burkholderia multivorans]
MSTQDHSKVIELSNISKIYRSYSSPRHRLLELMSAGKRQYFRETRALDDVSFSLEKGDRFGVVGENGSGKSTLLKILAGVLNPSSGLVSVSGRVSALLELGAGFNPELSGRENIVQFCMLHGMPQEQAIAAQPEIIRFSELGDAVDHPVKTYSSGMAVRLGFACAVYVQPDILIVDEALSVGDAYFQNKCLHKIRTMLDEGTTFIYVTHAADSVRALCNRGLWLEKGRVRLLGSSKQVGAAYQSEVFSRMVRAGIDVTEVDDEDASADTQTAVNDVVATRTRMRPDKARTRAFSSRVEPLRTGTGEIRIDDICVIDPEGNECDTVDIEKQIRVRVFFHVASRPPERSSLALGITDSSGRQILHFSSAVQDVFPSDATPHIQHVMEFTFANPLCPGEYGLIAGVGVTTEHPENRGQSLVTNVIDYCVGGARFSVRFPDEVVKRDLWGVVHVDYGVSMHSLD